MFTKWPPSSVIVAPLTYAPARLARKSAVPATSSGVPMRDRGMVLMTTSLIVSNVCAITTLKVNTIDYTLSGQMHSLLDSNGPHAMVLLVMPSTPNRLPRCRLK